MLARYKQIFALNHDNMLRWCSILLVQEILLFGLFIAGTHGRVVKLEHPLTTDYVSFYAAGKLADEGKASLVYDQAIHGATEVAATQPGIKYVYFFYPPIFLLICAVFSHLPYLASFLAFETVTCALFLLVTRAILRPQGWGWLILILCFPACFAACGQGQNSFLTGALFGGATLVLDRRPALAGVLFGLICYKPHFGVLIPIVLLAGGHRRSFFAAGATVSLLIVASGIIFGWESWRAYIGAVKASQAIYQDGTIPFGVYITPFGAGRMLLLSSTAASALQICVSFCVAIVTAWIWWRDESMAVRAGSLIAATLLASPVALYYDLVIALIAIAWLATDIRGGPARDWERGGFVAIYLVALITSGLCARLTVPIGPVVGCLLLAISVFRSWRASHANTQLDQSHSQRRPVLFRKIRLGLPSGN